jgi:hypothetical protein
MNDNYQLVDDFWRWFQLHLADLNALHDPEAPLWDVVVAQLKQVDKHLWFELSSPDAGDREFIITAEGNVDAFAITDTLVARAPKIPGWQFIALKPPMGFDFKTTYEGIEFSPRSMWFLPLESSSRPRDLGLRIGVPNFTSAIERQAKNGVLVILDTALGERTAALGIQHIEVCLLPDLPETKGYIELNELPAYIEWRKRKLIKP